MDATDDLDSIAHTLRHRSWRLAFPPSLEASFEADTSDERCRRVMRQNWIGLAIYNAFLLGDWLLIRDIFPLSLVLHLAIMSPIMLGVNLLVARRPPAWIRESVLGGGIVLATIAILAVTLLSRSPLRSSEHLSTVLVILFATTVQRIRFGYVLAACLVSLCLYVAALSQFAGHDWQRMVVADAVFAGVVLFSVIGSYNLEAELRTSYLLGRLERLRNAELKTISRRDALTGLGNRLALDEAIARLGERVGAGASHPFAALIFDIDHFKVFNDCNGHLAGDACLRHVAALIADDAALGPDRLFRFGGEEFLAFLDGASRADALAVAERVRRSVESAAIRRSATESAVVTVSAGTAIGLDGSDVAGTIADADRALYEAKHGGRNRAQAWPLNAVPKAQAA